MATATAADAAPRWVLVTAGARRLGREFCLAFARAGWAVLCHHHTSVQAAQQTCQELTALGVAALPLAGDLASEGGRQTLFAAAWQASQGRLGAWVNNASVFEPDRGDSLDLTGLQQQLQVNLLAPLQIGSLWSQALASADEPMPGTPCLIHVLDQKVFNLNADYFSYTVSKLALDRSVALQAQALAPRLRVNAVAPGLIYPSGPQSQANFDRAAKVNLLRQLTPPAQVAEAGVFLANNPAITGITITVDSGQHLVPSERDIMFVAEQFKP